MNWKNPFKIKAKEPSAEEFDALERKLFSVGDNLRTDLSLRMDDVTRRRIERQAELQREGGECFGLMGGFLRIGGGFVLGVFVAILGIRVSTPTVPDPHPITMRGASGNNVVLDNRGNQLLEDLQSLDSAILTRIDLLLSCKGESDEWKMAYDEVAQALNHYLLVYEQSNALQGADLLSLSLHLEKLEECITKLEKIPD